MNDEQSNQDKHVVVATKLSRPAAERLAKIAKHKGMTIYELIQMVCDTLIRYMDDRYNLSDGSLESCGCSSRGEAEHLPIR